MLVLAGRSTVVPTGPKKKTRRWSWVLFGAPGMPSPVNILVPFTYPATIRSSISSAPMSTQAKTWPGTGATAGGGRSRRRGLAKPSVSKSQAEMAHSSALASMEAEASVM
jgi:hypothetical protein